MHINSLNLFDTCCQVLMTALGNTEGSNLEYYTKPHYLESFFWYYKKNDYILYKTTPLSEALL